MAYVVRERRPGPFLQRQHARVLAFGGRDAHGAVAEVDVVQREGDDLAAAQAHVGHEQEGGPVAAPHLRGGLGGQDGAQLALADHARQRRGAPARRREGQAAPPRGVLLGEEAQVAGDPRRLDLGGRRLQVRLLGLYEPKCRSLVDGLLYHDAVREQPPEEHAHDAAVGVDHGRRQPVGLEPLAEPGHLGAYLRRRGEVGRSEPLPPDARTEAHPVPLSQAGVPRVVVVRDGTAHEGVDGLRRFGLVGIQHAGICRQELAQLA